MIDASKYDIIKGHCILIGGKTFTLTYQKSDFVSNDSHNIVIRTKNESLSENVYLFLVTALKASLSSKYSWGDAVTKDKLLVNSIKLPATSDNQPDWVYMEQYMSKVGETVNSSLALSLSLSDSYSGRYDTTKWKQFTIGQLFKVEKGHRLTKKSMVDGDINYIGATAFNNGVTARIGNTQHLHPAGTLTVCYNGSIGQTFYQTEKFWATDDVNVLYPKFEMTPYVAQFFIPIITKLGQRYGYVDKWTAKKMTNTFLPLPVTPKGEPDFTFMETYMKSLELRVNRYLG